MMATRFIRVRGRIVPIKDDKTSERRGYGTSAAIGAAGGVVGGIGNLAHNLGARVGNVRAMKFGKSAVLGASVFGLAGLGYAVERSVAAGKKEGSAGRGFVEFLKHTLANTGGSIAGTTAVIGGATAKVALAHARRAKSLKRGF